VECSFLIPIRRDRNLADGRSHRTTAWAWLEEELCVFGGATRAPDLYEGWYLDPDTGERVRDRSRRYILAVPKSGLAKLRRLLRQACVKFAQKCIYLSIAGSVEFVQRPSHEAD
jgi:hypothetical protein